MGGQPLPWRPPTNWDQELGPEALPHLYVEAVTPGTPRVAVWGDKAFKEVIKLK